ncbi:hypothetical protein [Candidatus Palauibacter sp.]|uniref:hypothetical protein n=1 Tax=Candidatus Palauibacter sp. TaxID=3101350 RepID=UPI003B517CBA
MNQGKRDRKREDAPARGLQFGAANYAAFALGLTSIAAGYVLLDQGSVTAAPLLLILGYAVFLPAGLILGWRRLG